MVESVISHLSDNLDCQIVRSLDFVKGRRENPRMKAEKRRYSGQSFVHSQEDRRARLIQAALAVAGRFGLEGTSVAAICAKAGLTARYFYESYPSREAIFVDAYRMAQEVLLGRLGGERRGAAEIRRKPRLLASTPRFTRTPDWRASSLLISTTTDQQCARRVRKAG